MRRIRNLAAVPEDSAGPGVLARPDGFYWLAPDGHQEFGPFATVELAQMNRDAADTDHAPAPGESLEEAESEIGIAGWIDPETGELAEGQSPPRLDED